MGINFEEQIPQNQGESTLPEMEAERILKIEDLEVQDNEMKKIKENDPKFAAQVESEMEKILMEPGE